MNKITMVEKMEILEMLSDVSNIYKAKIVIISELANKFYGISIDTIEKFSKFEEVESQKMQAIESNDDYKEIISEFLEQRKTPYGIIEYLSKNVKIDAKTKKELKKNFSELQKVLTDYVKVAK